jgi:hypothetical protein
LRSLFRYLFCAFAAVAPDIPGATAAPRVVTAAEVNGTWVNEGNAFKVWALGRQRLRVEFSGSYERGATAHTGEARGIARIDGDTAVFEPRGAGRCRITMKFQRAKLEVDQDGECGFGLNVSADGTYSRKSRRKPHFAD